MHVLGKVMLGFVVVGAIAAIFLTTMALDVRTHWEELAIKEANHRDAQEALDRVKLTWGNVFLGPNSRPTNPATGAVNIGAGTQQGLGATAAARPANPMVHIFNVIDGQNSQYLGAFKVQSAQPGSADAVLSRPPFADENFPAGTWRVRELIPFDFASRFLDVFTKQIEADARLQRMEFDVTRLQEQLAASQKLLQERVFQLEGDPNLANAAPLQTKGYVQAIRDGLTERDELLAHLHDLRVERLLKLETLKMLTEDNDLRITRFSQETGAAAPAATASAN